MDNQQVRPLNDVELSWVAGILEGEGHVGIGRKITGDFQYVPRIQIINTDKKLLSEVVRILKSHDLSCYVKIRGIEQGKNRRIYEVVICGIGRVQRFLTALNPYIRGEKIDRAKIILDFCDQRKKYSPYTEQDHELYRNYRHLVENPRDYTPSTDMVKI